MRDTRQGLRRLVRDWRFTAAAVLILGLGIGATTAIFSLVNAALFRGQALPDPERLVEHLSERPRGPSGGDTRIPRTSRWRSTRTSSPASMATCIPNSVRYLHDGAVRNGVVEHTTPAYLDVLGLRPSLGRWFEEAEDTPGAPLVVVLGHQFWTRQFGADPSVDRPHDPDPGRAGDDCRRRSRQSPWHASTSVS